MNRGNAWVRGYTIVEVLIFLATTTALFAMSMRLIAGQEGKTQFVTTVRDMESTMNDFANNVATGYYTKVADFRCQVNGSGTIQILPPGGGGQQGTNEECIYAGTVIKFGENNAAGSNRYIEIPMAGRRQVSNRNVDSLIEAAPATIYSAPVPDAVKRSVLPHGAQFRCIKINNGSCGSGNAAIGFFTTFNGTDPNTRKGGIQADLLYFSGVDLTHFLSSAAATVNGTMDSLTTAQLSAMRPQKVDICITSGSSNQYALLTLGGGVASNLTVSTEIKDITGSQPVCS